MEPLGSSDVEPWVGAVLTGGASTRMGKDKASLLVDGVPMTRRVADALLAAGAAQVICVGPSVDGLASIVEDEPGQGPLPAMIAALRWADPRAVVIAPCDLVAPQPAAFAALVEGLRSARDADVALVTSGGRPQPIPAAYSPAAGRVLAAAHGAGELSVSRCLRVLRVAEVDGVDLRALDDADEPGDLGHYPRLA